MTTKAGRSLLEPEPLYAEPHSVKAYESYRSQRLVKPLTVVGCLVAAACLASTAANVYFYTQKSRLGSTTPRSCFQCSEVPENSPVDWKKVEVKDDICCMEQSDFLRLVEKVSLDAARIGLANALPTMPIASGSGGLSKPRPSVHLGLGSQPPWMIRKPEANGCNASGSTEIKHWKQDGNGHLRGDLSYRNGRIIIDSTGYYHVYSQVSSEDRSGSGSRPPQRHSIFRVNSHYQEPEELLTSETTRCKDPLGSGGRSSNNPMASSYVGAALLLFKGDQVFVKVSCLDDLKENGQETYFGMYMV